MLLGITSLVPPLGCAALAAGEKPPPLLQGQFQWSISPPLIAPASNREDVCYSVKDPSVVWFDGRWHLFCTIRSRKRTHQIEYLSFTNWKDADQAERHVLKLSEGYFCAPQVFYFSPHRQWYMICQINEPSRRPELQPACATTTRLADPSSWSKPVLLFKDAPTNIKMWIDFWVICDEVKAHLFFTSLDGRMWRAETRLADFPHGWSVPVVALEGDIFEASHTYQLQGLNKYLTLVEAQAEGRRYYKAYLANGLEGPWQPLADRREMPFAGPANTRPLGAAWTDSFSHGELLRAGFDERLEVAPSRLRFLFQGVSDQAKAGKSYGEIPWRLGLLEPQEERSAAKK